MKPKMIVGLVSWGISCLWLLTSQCVFPSKMAGNGSQTPNSAIVGIIYQPGGKGPARGDSVVLRPSDYLADIQRLSKRNTSDSPFVRQTRTDDSGHYRFDLVPKGSYCIEAHDCNNRVLITVDSSLFQGDTVKLPPDTLKAAAKARGKVLTGYDSAGTYVRAYGLDVIAKVAPDSTFTLANLPEGDIRLLISISIDIAKPYDTIANVNIRTGVDTLLSLSITDPKTIRWGITFQKTLCDSCYGESVQQASDGGYIIAGSVREGVGGYDVYLIKTYATGTVEWTKTFGGTGDDEAYYVQKTNDGGYIITGQMPDSAGKSEVCLIKTDPAGTAEWIKTFGDTGGEHAKSVQQTNDGGYIITGAIWRSEVSLYGTFLIKTDANGNVK